jgi:hypothetical protein
MPLPECHLYIAAMGRSGSTALCNLLTSPPRRLALVEPWLHLGAKSKTLLQQLQRFGFDVSEEDWKVSGKGTADEESTEDRLERLISPLLATLDRWAVKEVRPDFHDENIALLKPRKTLVLVRDIRDVVLSLLEKQARNPREGYDEAWVRDYIVKAARSAENLAPSAGAASRVVRYEDLVSKPELRRDLSQWLDWPMTGAATANMDLYGREYERQRHAGSVSTVSVNRHHRETKKDGLDLANEMSRIVSSYQRVFRYL